MQRLATLALGAPAVVVLWFLFLSASAAAQPPDRTTPLTLDLTCHGYDEGTTRAYNCIPEPSQQRYMRTFVPPVGSACDAGSIAEFPAGRIVFQIRCRDGSRRDGSRGQTAAWSHWGRGPASFDMPEDASARFWVHTAFSGSSVHFVVRCRAPQQRVVVNELLGRSWGNNGTNGIYGMAGCREIEVDTGGQDLQWWFTQELAATALMPPQSWERVTGAGGALPAQALQDLAGTVNLERLGGPPSQWGIQPPMDANDRAALWTSDAEGLSLPGPIASRPDDRTYALDDAFVRDATTRTAPLTLDLTCHGYVEPTRARAYNCIPEPSQQRYMRTFVPPVGSACDAGSIAEFPPGRIVFQIRCRDSDTVIPPTTEGKVAFWTNATRGWSNISITLDGSYIGSLTQYRDEAPRCVSSASTVVATRAPGTYRYRAEDEDNSLLWDSSNITIAAGRCLRFRLSCGDDRDCSPERMCTTDSRGFNTCAAGTFGRLAGRTGGKWWEARRASEVPNAILAAIDTAVSTGGSSFDLMFIIDITGSMIDDIAAVKSRATQIIDRIRSRGDGTERVGLALYSDRCVDSRWILFQDLTSDLGLIRRQIQGINVSGGGDKPESVYDAVELALTRASWRRRARYGILIGDAPPHERGDACYMTTFEEALSATRSTGVQINLFPILVAEF